MGRGVVVCVRPVKATRSCGAPGSPGGRAIPRPRRTVVLMVIYRIRKRMGVAAVSACSLLVLVCC